MGYTYENERERLFTDGGQRMLLSIRDRAFGLLKSAGAVTVEKMIGGESGDSWQMLACVDRLVELGDLREVTDPAKVWGQDRVFVRVGHGS